jgi:hypothetical protein
MLRGVTKTELPHTAFRMVSREKARLGRSRKNANSCLFGSQRHHIEHADLDADREMGNEQQCDQLHTPKMAIRGHQRLCVMGVLRNDRRREQVFELQSEALEVLRLDGREEKRASSPCRSTSATRSHRHAILGVLTNGDDGLIWANQRPLHRSFAQSVPGVSGARRRASLPETHQASCSGRIVLFRDHPHVDGGVWIRCPHHNHLSVVG